MKFQSVKIGAAVVGAATVVALAGGTPAQAAVLADSDLGLTGTARLDNPDVAIGGNSTINFKNFSAGTGNLTVESGTLSFAGLVGTNATLQDITLKRTAANLWELQTPLSQFIKLTNNVVYNADTFVLKKVEELGTSFYLATTSGTFFDPSDNTTIDAGGPFSTQSRFILARGDTFSGNVTAVPTPALLPGLVGMGIAAFRKRRSQLQKPEEVKV